MKAQVLLAIVTAIESVRLEIRGLDMVANAGLAEQMRGFADAEATSAQQIVRDLAETERAERKQAPQ